MLGDYTHTANTNMEFTMNRDTIAGSWKQFKGNVKVQWGRLTGNHNDIIQGKGSELAGKVQEDYGVTKDAVKHKIDQHDEQSK